MKRMRPDWGDERRYPYESTYGSYPNYGGGHDYPPHPASHGGGAPVPGPIVPSPSSGAPPQSGSSGGR